MDKGNVSRKWHTRTFWIDTGVSHLYRIAREFRRYSSDVASALTLHLLYILTLVAYID